MGSAFHTRLAGVGLAVWFVAAIVVGIPPPVAAAETTRTSDGTSSPSGFEAVPVGDRPITHQPARIYRTPFEIEDVLFFADGHAVIVEVDRTVGTSRITSVARDGVVVEGWPWTPSDGDEGTTRVDLEVARGAGDIVYALVRRSSVQRSPAPGSSRLVPGSRAGPVFVHELRLLDRSGRELPGFPVPLASTPFCGLDAHGDVAYVACLPG